MNRRFHARQYRKLLASHWSGPAFTLIELLLVMALMATLTGAAVVSLTGRQDGKALEYAARDLGAAMRSACKEAEARGDACRIVFFDGHRSYRVEHCTSDGASEYVPVCGVAGRLRRLPEMVCLVSVDCGMGWEASAPASIEWTRGNCPGYRIRLLGRGDDVYLIEMTPGTGIVSCGKQSDEN